MVCATVLASTGRLLCRRRITPSAPPSERLRLTLNADSRRPDTCWPTSRTSNIMRINLRIGRAVSWSRRRAESLPPSFPGALPAPTQLRAYVRRTRHERRDRQRHTHQMSDELTDVVWSTRLNRLAWAHSCRLEIYAGWSRCRFFFFLGGGGGGASSRDFPEREQVAQRGDAWPVVAMKVLFAPCGVQQNCVT